MRAASDDLVQECAIGVDRPPKHDLQPWADIIMGPLGAPTAAAGVAASRTAPLHPLPVHASNSPSCNYRRESQKGSACCRPTPCSTSPPAAACACWQGSDDFALLEEGARSSSWPPYLQGLALRPRWPNASPSGRKAVLRIFSDVARGNSSFSAKLARGRNVMLNLILWRVLTVLAEQLLVGAQRAPPHLHPWRRRSAGLDSDPALEPPPPPGRGLGSALRRTAPRRSHSSRRHWHSSGTRHGHAQRSFTDSCPTSSTRRSRPCFGGSLLARFLPPRDGSLARGSAGSARRMASRDPSRWVSSCGRPTPSVNQHQVTLRSKVLRMHQWGISLPGACEGLCRWRGTIETLWADSTLEPLIEIWIWST